MQQQGGFRSELTGFMRPQQGDFAFGDRGGKGGGRERHQYCADSIRPSCIDGSTPARDPLTGRPVCSDGATPLCSDGSAPARREPHGRGCTDGVAPTCFDGSVPTKDPLTGQKLCADGGSPLCSDGSVPLPREDGGHHGKGKGGRGKGCDDGNRPLCADGTFPVRPDDEDNLPAPVTAFSSATFGSRFNAMYSSTRHHSGGKGRERSPPVCLDGSTPLCSDGTAPTKPTELVPLPPSPPTPAPCVTFMCVDGSRPLIDLDGNTFCQDGTAPVCTSPMAAAQQASRGLYSAGLWG